MAGKQRLIRQALKSARDPARVDFYELVRNLDRSDPDMPPTGWAGSAREEQLRFSQRPEFHSSDHTVAGVTVPEKGTAQATIEVFSPGLCGVDGPMPLDFTGMVMNQTRNNYDYVLQRFLDLINHRFIALFYRAHAANSEAISFDQEQERDLNTRIARALSGADPHGKFNLPPYAAESLGPVNLYQCAGKAGLERALERFFGICIKVKPFIFETYTIPVPMRCVLGRRNATLGQDAQIGSHYFSNTKKIVLRLGPMDFKDCGDLLPGGRKYRQLNELINFYLRKPLSYDLEFVLKKDSLEGVSLNGGYALGRSTCFKFKHEGGNCIMTINASRLETRGETLGG